MKTVFDDRYQSENDPPSGQDGTDHRSRVSWNSYCSADDDIEEALDDQWKRMNG